MKKHMKTFHVPASDTICINCARWIQCYIWDGEEMVRGMYGHCCTAGGNLRRATGRCNKYLPESNTCSKSTYSQTSGKRNKGRLEDRNI